MDKANIVAEIDGVYIYDAVPLDVEVGGRSWVSVDWSLWWEPSENGKEIEHHEVYEHLGEDWEDDDSIAAGYWNVGGDGTVNIIFYPTTDDENIIRQMFYECYSQPNALKIDIGNDNLSGRAADKVAKLSVDYLKFLDTDLVEYGYWGDSVPLENMSKQASGNWFASNWFKSSVDETEFNQMIGESYQEPQSGDTIKLLITPEGLEDNEEGIIVGSFRSNGETFYSIDLDSQQGEGTVDIFLPREDFEVTSERSEDELEMLWRGSSVKQAEDWFSDNPEDFFAFNIGDPVYVITEDEVGEITDIGQYYTVVFSDGTEGEYGSDEVDYPEPDFLKDSMRKEAIAVGDEVVMANEWYEMTYKIPYGTKGVVKEVEQADNGDEQYVVDFPKRKKLYVFVEPDIVPLEEFENHFFGREGWFKGAGEIVNAPREMGLQAGAKVEILEPVGDSGHRVRIVENETRFGPHDIGKEEIVRNQWLGIDLNNSSQHDDSYSENEFELFDAPLDETTKFVFVDGDPSFWRDSDVIDHIEVLVEQGATESSNILTGIYYPEHPSGNDYVEATAQIGSEEPTIDQLNLLKQYIPQVQTLEWVDSGKTMIVASLVSYMNWFKESDWWQAGETIGDEEAYDLAWELYGDRPPQHITNKILQRFNGVRVRQIEALINWANKHESDPEKKMRMILAWARNHPERVRKDTPQETPESPQMETQTPQSEPVEEQSDSDWMKGVGEKNRGNPRLREWAVSSLNPWFSSTNG